MLSEAPTAIGIEKPFEFILAGGHEAGALFSSDMQRRFSLWRQNGVAAQVRRVLWILLNPSTADEKQLDPTLTRCLDFTHRWGANSMSVCNLFAYRATDPKQMRKWYRTHDAHDETNTKVILTMASRADLIIYAWGNMGKLYGRDEAITELIDDQVGAFKCAYLDFNVRGRTPKHPLYIPADMKPKAWVSGKPLEVDKLWQ